MGWHRRRWSGWRAWLGVIALGLNALVPVHLAFDLADALQPAHHAPAKAGGLARRLIALACGHREGDDDHHHHGKHGEPGCPVCAVAGTLAGLALPAAAALPRPAATAARLDVAVITAEAHPAPAAAYRSRAPPLA